MQWTDGSTNETTFRIEARSGGGPFEEIGNVPANTTFFTAEGGAASTHYDFRVRARNASGNSNYSNVAGANTLASTAPCVRDNNTACLLNGKFRITGEMKNNQSQTFPLQVMDFPSGRAESTEASFWESFQTGNFEIAIKVLDGCSVFPLGHPLHFYWAFFGGLTDKRTDMTVVDTLTFQQLTFHNPPNTFPTTIANTMAFPCSSPGGAGPCTANATTACLLGGRFSVTGSMRNAQDQVFTTKVMQFPGPVSLQSRARAETDQAAFFQSFSPGNFEIGVKMLDACTLQPGHPLRFYWIFYGGLTDAQTEVRAVHTTTGSVDLFRNPKGIATDHGRQDDGLRLSVGRPTLRLAGDDPAELDQAAGVERGQRAQRDRPLGAEVGRLALEEERFAAPVAHEGAVGALVGEDVAAAPHLDDRVHPRRERGLHHQVAGAVAAERDAPLGLVDAHLARAVGDQQRARRSQRHRRHRRAEHGLGAVGFSGTMM